MARLNSRRGYCGLPLIDSTTLSMFGALAVGTGLAIGRHLLYASLNGMRVSEGNFFYSLHVSITRQQFNLTVGNAFAFASKAALGIAITNAYVQLLWQSARRRSQS